jgi:hypothetical protein
MSDDPLLDVQRDLREISRLATWLQDQALHRSNDKTMPGGEALATLAPVASPEAVENRIDGITRWNANHYGEPEQQIDQSHLNDLNIDEHALDLLLFWTEVWRMVHNREIDSWPTFTSETGFLTDILNWIHDNEPRFDAFANDVHEVRQRLENILYDGRRAERTRVPCPDCSTRLIRIYADLAKYDHWRCPNKQCDRDRFDKDDYDRARHIQLDTQGADRFILVPDAIAAVKQDRTENTVRTWIKLLKVRRICDITTRQVMVWWPDIRDLNAEAKHRTVKKRNKAA